MKVRITRLVVSLNFSTGARRDGFRSNLVHAVELSGGLVVTYGVRSGEARTVLVVVVSIRIGSQMKRSIARSDVPIEVEPATKEVFV